MDTQLKAKCEKLRSMSSGEASKWLIEKYPISSPDYGEAIKLLPHRSWGKVEQVRLAEYYFQKIPFSSGAAYEAFASFMSISLMVKIIRNFLPTSETDISLLVYCLVPVLKKHIRSAKDGESVNELLVDLGMDL